MIRVEDKNVFLWLGFVLVAYLVWSVSFGGLFGLFGGLYVAGPLAVEFSSTETMSGAQGLSPKQTEFLERETMRRMKEVNWWVWWPLLTAVASAITGAFLGFARMVRYNLVLLLLFYLTLIFSRSDEWVPPGSLVIDGATLLTSALVLRLSNRWVYKIQTGT